MLPMATETEPRFEGIETAVPELVSCARPRTETEPRFEGIET